MVFWHILAHGQRVKGVPERPCENSRWQMQMTTSYEIPKGGLPLSLCDMLGTTALAQNQTERNRKTLCIFSLIRYTISLHSVSAGSSLAMMKHDEANETPPQMPQRSGGLPPNRPPLPQRRKGWPLSANRISNFLNPLANFAKTKGCRFVWDVFLFFSLGHFSLLFATFWSKNLYFAEFWS